MLKNVTIDFLRVNYGNKIRPRCFFIQCTTYTDQNGNYYLANEEKNAIWGGCVGKLRVFCNYGPVHLLNLSRLSAKLEGFVYTLHANFNCVH